MELLSCRTIRHKHANLQSPNPPGGGPDLTTAGLRPVDAIVFLNAHPSRARLNIEWLDPAITDESKPFDRDPKLDMYASENAAPYSPEFIATYRAAQLARNRRISAWAEQQLAQLQTADQKLITQGLDDLAFVVHGTAADLRFLDGNIDPSDREIGVTLWAHHGLRTTCPPESAESPPVARGLTNGRLITPTAIRCVG